MLRIWIYSPHLLTYFDGVSFWGTDFAAGRRRLLARRSLLILACKFSLFVEMCYLYMIIIIINNTWWLLITITTRRDMANRRETWINTFSWMPGATKIYIDGYFIMISRHASGFQPVTGMPAIPPEARGPRSWHIVNYFPGVPLSSCSTQARAKYRALYAGIFRVLFTSIIWRATTEPLAA